MVTTVLDYFDTAELESGIHFLVSRQISKIRGKIDPLQFIAKIKSL